MPYVKDWSNESIDKFEFSTRASLRLKDINVFTIQDLINTPLENIEEIYHIGSQTIDNIVFVMKELGFIPLCGKWVQANSSETFEVYKGEIKSILGELKSIKENIYRVEKRLKKIL